MKQDADAGKREFGSVTLFPAGIWVTPLPAGNAQVVVVDYSATRPNQIRWNADAMLGANNNQ